MNSMPNFTNNSWKSLNRLLAPLALALTMAARAGTQPAAIPLADISARATANYQGNALSVMATPDGARLRCGFQKLEGHATPEGLWLESTKPGAAGRLRLVAVAVGRGGNRARQCALTEPASSVRSAMSIVTVPQGAQAPLGAPCAHGAVSFFDIPLLTELETIFSDPPFSSLNSPPSTVLPSTGQVSVADKLVRFTRPGLTEEYSVSVDGVRQDFIIESPPVDPQPLGSPKRSDGGSTLNQSAGDLRVELTLSGARAEAAAGGVRLRLDGSGRALAYNRLRVEDATGRELMSRLEVLSPSRLALSVADANATYPVRIDPTFSDADWVSLNPGVPGAYGSVFAIVADGSGNVYVGGLFIMIGTVPANHVAKWDGSRWSALGSGIAGVSSPGVVALAVSGSNVYVGGMFSTASGGPANYIAKWDGRAWSPLGSGVNGSVNALAVIGTNLYAGGDFGMAGGMAATRIAKWDGSAWSALGLGMNNDVNALAVSGTNLYAGGYFSAAGGATANYVAEWDGSVWSALGSGMNNSVFALAVSGTNLYAGGWPTTAGGVPATTVAQWNGSAWSALGSGMVGNSTTPLVLALAASGTNLYAGGDFTVPAYHIAKWNGSYWSALGGGIGGSFDSYVAVLAVSGTDLYAGGSFTMAGTVTARYIAKWNGSSWSALGSGMSGGSNPCVYALAVSGTNLYAGGRFTTAGGVPAINIAKWNGRSWSALGSGLNSDVSALAVSGTNLYAGGNFTSAGGVPANYIAKWDGTAWSALGSSGVSGGSNPGVLALAADGAGHLFVGGSFSLAGTNVSPYIAQANLGSVVSVVTSPQSQTAEIGATVDFAVDASGGDLAYQWFSNTSNSVSLGTKSQLVLTNVQFSQSGTYTVVVTYLFGPVTSSPVMLNVIAPVDRKLVLGVNVMGQAGSLLGLDYSDHLGPSANWETMATMTLSNSSQFYPDVSQPLPPQRFYRAWQSGTPSMRPSLDLQLVPAITLTGTIGHSVRVDYINQFGPIDAWVTLATVPLTNTSQLYFDTSAPGQPQRLYRLVTSP